MSLSKADFDSIYNQPDAAAYFSTLGALDYVIPQHGADVFSAVLECRSGDQPTVLDVCCSYGVGGALLKTDLNLDDLYAHYREAAQEGLTEDKLMRADIDLLERHRVPNSPRVLGLDVADQAARYAVATDSLDAAFVENLEDHDPSPELASEMSGVDVITTTGGIGYVTERTFSRLLDASENTPWVAAFCLRAYDFQPIADSLAERGLVTEKAPSTYAQRRFLDAEEQKWATNRVIGADLDPTGLESSGRYFADFYLARPADDVAALALADLLPA